MPPQVFIIEGEIGAGKTELALGLAGALRARGVEVALALEPVELWKQSGILELFYADPARYAYAFQTYVFATRVAAINAALAATPGAHVALLERSPATDQIFMELQRDQVSPVEMAMYYTWCGEYARLLPLDLATARVLYLKPDIAVCMARVAGRHRAGEVGDDARVGDDAPQSGGVTRDYQLRLRRAHEAFFQGLHHGEFPHLPVCPFLDVTEISGANAAADFRLDGADHGRVIGAVLAEMGFA